MNKKRENSVLPAMEAGVRGFMGALPQRPQQQPAAAPTPQAMPASAPQGMPQGAVPAAGQWRPGMGGMMRMGGGRPMHGNPTSRNAEMAKLLEQ